MKKEAADEVGTTGCGSGGGQNEAGEGLRRGRSWQQVQSLPGHWCLEEALASESNSPSTDYCDWLVLLLSTAQPGCAATSQARLHILAIITSNSFLEWRPPCRRRTPERRLSGQTCFGAPIYQSKCFAAALLSAGFWAFTASSPLLGEHMNFTSHPAEALLHPVKHK